ncbi:MAG: hypothetical protein U0S12_12745 [Fimbriimonadales bacterium]
MEQWKSTHSIFTVNVAAHGSRLTLELYGQYAFKPFCEYRRTIVYPLLRLLTLGSPHYHLLATDTKRNSSIIQLLGDPIRTYGLYMIESEIGEHPNPEISGYYRKPVIPDEHAWDALFVHGSFLGWTGDGEPETLVEYLRTAEGSTHWLKDVCRYALPDANVLFYALHDGHDLGIQIPVERWTTLEAILNGFDGPLFEFLQRHEGGRP